MDCEEPTRVRPLEPALRRRRHDTVRMKTPSSGVPAVHVAPAPPRLRFREPAVAAHLARVRESEVLRVAPPWVRGMLVVASLAASVLVASTFVVDVDQTARGRGVLRTSGGVQTVAAQTSGTVIDVGARSGEAVTRGALLVRVDSTPTKSALLEAERRIARAEADVAAFGARRDKEQAARLSLLGRRTVLLQKRAESQRASVARLEQHLAAFDRLAGQGLAPANERSVPEGELASAQRTVIQLEEEVAATRLQGANIQAELGTELDRLRAEVQRAKDQRDTLAFQLEQTEIRAPGEGRIEAMVVKPGESVAVGAPIARLVPDGAPRQVVVFLPEADRAFLHEGAFVRLELDQLPAGEFGALRARVTRIGQDLATPADVSDALGQARLEAPAYRVELEIVGDDVARRLDRWLRPGSQVTARFALRRQRLAALLFSPLKRWFEG